MLIQVDVDSTLYDADKLFGDLAEEAGIKWPRKAAHWLPAEAIMKHDGTPCSREDLSKVFRKAHSKEVIMEQKPYIGAAATLGRLVDVYDDIEIAYVSDRNEQQNAALRDWLDSNGFLHTEDQHVVTTKDKRRWMREKTPEIVIDDRVRTMLMARFELGSYVLSLRHPWNINLTGEVDHIYLAKRWGTQPTREYDTDTLDRILNEIVIPKVQEKSLSVSKQRFYARS